MQYGICSSPLSKESFHADVSKDRFPSTTATHLATLRLQLEPRAVTIATHCRAYSGHQMPWHWQELPNRNDALRNDALR